MEKSGWNTWYAMSTETLAVDGRLVDGVVRLLGVLRDRLTIHLLDSRDVWTLGADRPDA